jgi:acid stress-induced BolA-like protein IbaG/YrbA
MVEDHDTTRPGSLLERRVSVTMGRRMMAPEDIRATLERVLPGSDIQVTDLTGGLDHFQVLVVSPLFEGKTLIERHQLVQTPLRPAVEDGRIHALSLKTYTPEQWRKLLR